MTGHGSSDNDMVSRSAKFYYSHCTFQQVVTFNLHNCSIIVRQRKKKKNKKKREKQKQENPMTKVALCNTSELEFMETN